MGKNGLTIICVLIAFLFVAAGPGSADKAAKTEDSQKAEETTQPKQDAKGNNSGGLLDFTLPDGFEELPQEEPGIRKWAKDNGEIMVVVGDRFSDSQKDLFEKLLGAAKKNKKYEAVEKLDLKGGLGLAFREKKSGDPERLRSWRVIVLAGEKILNVDFAAPEKEFDGFLPRFQATLKSFRLKQAGD